MSSPGLLENGKHLYEHWKPRKQPKQSGYSIVGHPVLLDFLHKVTNKQRWYIPCWATAPGHPPCVSQAAVVTSAWPWLGEGGSGGGGAGRQLGTTLRCRGWGTPSCSQARMGMETGARDQEYVVAAPIYWDQSVACWAEGSNMSSDSCLVSAKSFYETFDWPDQSILWTPLKYITILAVVLLLV